METSAKRLENDILEVTVTVDPEDVKKAVASTYKEMARKYRFPGFRPGHAPRPVIDNNVGKQAVLAEATESLVNSIEPQVLEQEDIVPVGNPMFPGAQPVVEGEPFEFVVRYTVRPELSLTSFEPVDIVMPTEEVTEEEIDAQVDVFRNYFTTYEDIKPRKVKAQDSVFLSCHGVENAENFDFDNRLYVLGSGNMPEDFDNALIGMKPGDEKNIAFDVPGPAPAEGEEAPEPMHVSIDVTVNRLVERTLPEVTDEFAKNRFGFDDVAAMREAIKAEISVQKKQAMSQIKENRVTGRLAERLEGEPTKPYINTIEAELGQNFMATLSSRGISFDSWLAMNGLTSDQFMTDLEHQATDIARESLALDALVREKGFECTEEDLDKEFQKAGVNDWEAAKKQFLKDGRLPAIRVSIRRNKAIDWLLETAEVTISDEPQSEAKSTKKTAASKSTSKKAATKKSDSGTADSKAEKKPAAKKATAKKSSAAAAAADSEAKAASEKKTTTKKPAAKKTAASADSTDKPAAKKKSSAKKTTSKKADE